MKLCYICHEYPACVAHYGGIGVALQQEAEWFARSGNEVHVVCETAEMMPGRFVQNRVQIHVLKPSRTPKLGAFLNRFRVGAVARTIMGDSTGLVISADYGGPLFSKPFTQPLLVQLHGCASLNARYRPARRHRLQRWCERRTVMLSSAIRAVSRYSGEQTLLALGINGRVAHVIPNPIDVDGFHPTPEAVDRNLILFVGKLTEIKGAHLLPTIVSPVLRQFPEARLEVVGQETMTDGRSFKQAMTSQIPEDLRSRFAFVGRLPRQEVRGLLARANIVLMPSLSEACPLVALEAMASGRPVVASRRGGIPELIKPGEDGLLADPDEPDSFTTQLARLLTEPALADHIGQSGRKRVLKNHSPVRVNGLIESFYRAQLCIRT